MAFGGKAAGIVSGLTVGVVAGVYLAASNPILPRTDQTKVSTVDGQAGSQNGSVSTDPLERPKIALGTQSPVPTNPVPDVPDAGGQAPSLPLTTTSEDKFPPNIKVANPDPVIAPTATTELALSSAADGTQQPTIAPAPEAPELGAGDTAPQLRTQPAQPIALDEPVIGAADVLEPVENPEADQSPQTSVLQTAQAEQPVQALQIPEVPAQTDTQLAALPNLQSENPPKPEAKPEAIEPPEQAENPAPAQPELPAKPAKPELPELPELPETAEVAPADEATRPAIGTVAKQPKSAGTFKTSGGLLTTSDSNGNRLASLGTGKRRFPSIGDDPVAADNEPPALQKGALDRNSVPFETTGKPLLSLIVYDPQISKATLDQLGRLPIPVAIAVPVDAPEAAQNARIYRNAGFEVLAMSPTDVSLSLSGGQTNLQVANLLKAFFASMPDAIGLIDKPTANLQKDQKLARAVIEDFQRSGHGLVTYKSGFNSVPRIAGQVNVPATSVFKVLDGDGEDLNTIKRTLNRAAFEARSKGHVVLMSGASDVTLNAIQAWFGGPNARAVSAAPVSAALLFSAGRI